MFFMSQNTFYIVYPLIYFYICTCFLCFCLLTSIPELKVIYASPLQYYSVLYLSLCLNLPAGLIFLYAFVLLFSVFSLNLKGSL